MSIFTLFLTLCAIATTVSAAPYSNREKGFTVDFPKSWEIKENFLGMAALAVSPSTGKTDEFRENVNIVVGTLPKPTTAKAYFDLNVGVMRKIFSEFKIEQMGVSKLGRDESRWLVYTHRMKNMRVKVLLYFVTRDTRGFAVTASATPKTFPKYFATFTKIGKSFRITETPAITRK